MSDDPEHSKKRRVLSIARKYRRDGYRVMIPGRNEGLPDFLGDHVPDLIAESDKDKVVVEVKQAKALRGANNLIDLARRVEGEPGWRLELVTLEAGNVIGLVSHASVESLKDEIGALMKARFFNAAFIYAWAGLENILSSMAVVNGINPANVVHPKLLRDLATRGLISANLRESIETESALRRRLVHFDDEINLASSDVERLIALCEGLYEEAISQQAA